MQISPIFYRLKDPKDLLAFENLKQEKNPTIFDEIESQIIEWIQCKNPHLTTNDIQKSNLVDEKLGSQNIEHYGVWVYYSWKNHLVHLLDEDEFIEVRTNRNQYKITKEEQETLRSKKLGIVGLSVGRSISLIIAIERIAGEIRLADFDQIDLSNLNRIQAPISELGKNKCISAAEEILEIDPFLKVICFTKGLQQDNMEEFFTGNGVLDALIEECDDVKMKIQARLKARELRIPVIMETNSLKVVDVERYDLYDNIQPFNLKHDISEKTDQELDSKNLLSFGMTVFQDIEIPDSLSKTSHAIGSKLVAWYQLFSNLTQCSGFSAQLVRHILLNSSSFNGRISMSSPDK